MDPADFYFFNHKKGRSINQLVQFANELIIVFLKNDFIENICWILCIYLYIHFLRTECITLRNHHINVCIVMLFLFLCIFLKYNKTFSKTY